MLLSFCSPATLFHCMPHCYDPILSQNVIDSLSQRMRVLAEKQEEGLAFSDLFVTCCVDSRT